MRIIIEIIEIVGIVYTLVFLLSKIIPVDQFIYNAFIRIKKFFHDLAEDNDSDLNYTIKVIDKDKECFPYPNEDIFYKSLKGINTFQELKKFYKEKLEHDLKQQAKQQRKSHE